ncbi:MAG: hypothetical protein WCD07_00625 [Burkholderiales bacterium]
MENLLRKSLEQLQSDQIKTGDFIRQWREQNPLLPELPEKYHPSWTTY